MRRLLETMRAQLEGGGDAVLVTVISSSGSTPRGAGARMLVTAEGRLCGTVGGGVLEYRCEQIATGLLGEHRSQRCALDLSAEDRDRLGMICGGHVDVFFLFISGGDQDTIAVIGEMERALKNAENLWLVMDMTDEGRLGLYTDVEGFRFIDVPVGAERDLIGGPHCVTLEGRTFYAEKIAFSEAVYVFGCGHVGQALVPVLSSVGFNCVALDDRPEFADRRLFPDAVDVRVIDFEHIDQAVNIGPDDYVVVMTRGHACDTIVQAQALKTSCCYLGVIGSRRKKAGVFEKLREMGFTDKDLERVTTPIGLEIGAETPEEIAISIAAQMISVRRSRL